VIERVRFDQLYKMNFRRNDKNPVSYIIIRNRVVDWEPREVSGEFYYIERTDLMETPRRVYTQAIEKANFKKFWFQDLIEVTSKKEKIIVALKTGLSER
jgi:hypothetical protein